MPSTDLERMYDLRDVERFTALNASTIYRRIKAGRFPAPRQIGPKRVAWFESDLLAWQRALPHGTKGADHSPARFKAHDDASL
jgi:prophage regulatory protein